MSLDDEYIVEQFTVEESDIQPLAELLTGAFLGDDIVQQQGGSIILSAENFKLIFGSPIIDNEMFVRVRHKSTNAFVGFIGAISKVLSIDGKKYKISLPAWLSVHVNHRKKGLATAMGIRMHRLAMEKGYDAGIAFHEHDGHHGLEASQAMARETNTPLHELAFMRQYIVRCYDVKNATKVIKVKWYEKLYFKLKQRVKKVKSSRIRLYTPDDIDQIYDLSHELVDRNQVAIVQNREDLKWKLGSPNVLCIVHEDENGKINGFINGWEFLLAGFGHSVKFGWLDTVHTHNLASKEAQNLANFMGQEAKKLGWKGLQTPYIPYFDPKPLKAANFIFYRKKLGLYLFDLSGMSVPENVKSIYFEWR
ncbi:MAG: hypothetical protein FK733_11740 [Asgard group archaeon]|nr:hypothetical protein [Asgard group archaeon]